MAILRQIEARERQAQALAAKAELDGLPLSDQGEQCRAPVPLQKSDAGVVIRSVCRSSITPRGDGWSSEHCSVPSSRDPRAFGGGFQLDGLAGPLLGTLRQEAPVHCSQPRADFPSNHLMGKGRLMHAPTIEMLCLGLDDLCPRDHAHIEQAVAGWTKNSQVVGMVVRPILIDVRHLKYPWYVEAAKPATVHRLRIVRQSDLPRSATSARQAVAHSRSSIRPMTAGPRELQKGELYHRRTGGTPARIFNSLIRHIHDRMPVILEQDQVAAWWGRT